MNITAKEAAAQSNEIRKPIDATPEFQEIMSRIEREIRRAIDDGLRSIEIISYCLPVYNNYTFPSFIKRIDDLDHFWWPFVRDELVKNGFKVGETITRDHYIVSW